MLETLGLLALLIILALGIVTISALEAMVMRYRNFCGLVFVLILIWIFLFFPNSQKPIEHNMKWLDSGNDYTCKQLTKYRRCEISTGYCGVHCNTHDPDFEEYLNVVGCGLSKDGKHKICRYDAKMTFDEIKRDSQSYIDKEMSFNEWNKKPTVVTTGIPGIPCQDSSHCIIEPQTIISFGCGVASGFCPDGAFCLGIVAEDPDCFCPRAEHSFCDGLGYCHIPPLKKQTCWMFSDGVQNFNYSGLTQFCFCEDHDIYDNSIGVTSRKGHFLSCNSVYCDLDVSTDDQGPLINSEFPRNHLRPKVNPDHAKIDQLFPKILHNTTEYIYFFDGLNNVSIGGINKFSPVFGSCGVTDYIFYCWDKNHTMIDCVDISCRISQGSRNKAVHFHRSFIRQKVWDPAQDEKISFGKEQMCPAEWEKGFACTSDRSICVQLTDKTISIIDQDLLKEKDDDDYWCQDSSESVRTPLYGNWEKYLMDKYWEPNPEKDDDHHIPVKSENSDDDHDQPKINTSWINQNPDDYAIVHNDSSHCGVNETKNVYYKPNNCNRSTTCSYYSIVGNEVICDSYEDLRNKTMCSEPIFVNETKNVDYRSNNSNSTICRPYPTAETQKVCNNDATVPQNNSQPEEICNGNMCIRNTKSNITYYGHDNWSDLTARQQFEIIWGVMMMIILFVAFLIMLISCCLRGYKVEIIEHVVPNVDPPQTLEPTYYDPDLRQEISNYERLINAILDHQNQQK